jgi:hypothetical protein
MHTPCLAPDWSSIIARISEVADLEATARAFGAIKRVRKLKWAEDVLRLALMYGPGQLSLRTTAALAGQADLVDLSDKGVLGRLRTMGDWLQHLLQRLLEDNRGLSCGEDGLNLALVDGSVICKPGSKGSDWRLHARFDPGRGCFADLVLTPGTQAERVDVTDIEPGQTIVQDRGFARVRDFAAVLAAKADFITRIGWNALVLRDAQGQRLDPLHCVPPGDEPADHAVFIKGLAAPLRLVIQRIPSEKAEPQRKRVARRANRNGNRLDPRTLTAADYLMVVTSLPAQAQPAERIIAMYRNRWQVELGFKRLKTLAGLDKLPAMDPDVARTWLLAHLIVAVLTDEIASQIVAFPP